MAKYASGNQERLRLGFIDNNENDTSLRVVGRVGIGTTVFDANSSLDVRGDVSIGSSITADAISGIITATSFYGDGSNLSGVQSNVVDDTNPQLGGDLDVNGNDITGTGNVNLTGVITATSFSGSGSSLTNIPNSALDNSTVSYGGVQLSLGGSDDTPAFDLQDATNYPYSSLTGITTEILGDTTPQLGGDLDVNGNDITGTGNINLTGIITATEFVGNLTGTATTATRIKDINAAPSSGIGYVLMGNDYTATFNGGIQLQTDAAGIYYSHSSNTLVVSNVQSTDLTVTNNAKVTGISTLGTVEVSSGIVTASSGIVTYYGDGSKLSGLTASQVDGAITGITVEEEGSSVGTSVTAINFVSGNLTATASGVGATITLSDTPTFTTVTGNLTGTATTATALETARNFSVTGDFVTAPAVSFDGTGAVALAATITADSITLGTYTSGDYVESVSGTANEIEVTSGTGEGSAPTIGFVANPTIGGNVTIGQDLTVTRDLKVTRNLNVDGTVTIGGTSATIFAETLKVSDPDLILGIRTDANGNDISNDTTANHGGIAIASTEGSPLVTLVNPGAGETLPSTYKKIMWFKTSSFAGLSTDAWLSNYAFGVGTTSMSAGTKFAVGNIEADFDDITAVRHINSTGIITATTFSGSGSSLNSIPNSALDNSTVSYGGVQLSLGGSDDTPAFDLQDATNYPYSSLTGITTEIVGDTTPQLGGNLDVNNNDITGTGNINLTGIITATSFVGDGTGITGLTASQVDGAITGITVEEEGSSVGTSVTAINFVSSNLTATASGVGATITLTDTPTFTTVTGNLTGTATTATNADLINIQTQTLDDNVYYIPFEAGVGYTSLYIDTALSYNPGQDLLTFTNVQGSNISLYDNLDVTGISTLGTVKISSGIVTASSGIVTYYGDGSKLSGLTASQVGSLAGVTIQEEGSPVGTAGSVGNINFVSSNLTATASGVGATITLSDTPSFTSVVVGSAVTINSSGIDAGVGVVTATSFSGDGSNLTGLPSSGYWEQTDVGIHTLSNVGIGTTDATSVVDANNTSIVHAGVVTANYYYGDGSKLTGLTASQVGSLAGVTIQEEGSNVGTAGSVGNINFVSSNLTATASGVGATITLTETPEFDNLTITGVSTFQDNVKIPDNKRIDFGTSADLQIYHNGSESVLKDGTGNNLYVQASVVRIAELTGTGDMAVFTEGGAAELYYNNSKKFETTSVGVAVSGIVTATSGVVTYYGDGSNLTGLTGASAATYGSSSVTPIITVDSNGRITGISTAAAAAGGISNVVEDTTPQLGGTLDTNGNLIQFGDSATATDDRLIFGAGQDLQIYHDGEENNSYITESGSGDLRIQADDLSILSTNGNQTKATFTTDGSVDLYYNGSKKFETTANGIAVAGVVTASSGIVTYYGDGSNLTGLTAGIGIQSGGNVIGTGVTSLNFVGTGNVLTLNGDTVDISISGSGGDTTRTVNTYTATAGQTTFSATYTVGYVDVFLNGAKLSENEYTATNGTSIVLDTGASLDDIVEVVSFTDLNISTPTSISLTGPYTQTVVSLGTTDVNLSSGNYFTKAVSAASTFTFSNPPSSGIVQSFTLEIDVTGTGTTIDWPTEVEWNGNSAPSLTDTKTHLFMFVTRDGGSTYRGSALVDYTT